MTWLVDTDLIPESRKGRRCQAAVAAWWPGIDDRALFLRALTLGGIRKPSKGLSGAPPAKATALEAWLIEIAGAFGPRVLGVDVPVAEAWGRVSAARTIPFVDALLAATTNVHNLVLVTRSAAGRRIGGRVLDPFAAAPR